MKKIIKKIKIKYFNIEVNTEYNKTIHPRYTPDTPQIHPRYIPDTPQIHPRYTPDTPQIHPRYIPDTSQIHPQIHPRYTPDISQRGNTILTVEISTEMERLYYKLRATTSPTEGVLQNNKREGLPVVVLPAVMRERIRIIAVENHN